jgi:hypothetical protein
VSAPPASPAPADRAGRIFDAVLRAACAILLASMLAAALHDVSQSWDVWYYHLPFAARLGGVLGPGDFVFSAENQPRFEGYPRLGELLQGLLWRATGRAESANLVAFSAVPLLAWLLQRRFRVPFHLTVLGLFAVPLVQLHATSCYVDLPGNAGAAALVVIAAGAWASREPVSRSTLLLAGIAAAVAVNMRFQLHPLVLVALIAIAWRALPPIFRDLRGEPPARSSARVTLAAITLALPFVFATPLANLAAHQNPYYPERLSVLGHELPGPEDPYDSSPPWLAHLPRPVRFACSLLEIGVRPFSERRRWTVDQWMPDADGSRMGGFFNAYVIALLAIFAWRVARDRSRLSRASGVAFTGLTALIAVMPQSHELRYYQVWMIALVALNLVLACQPHEEEGEEKRKGAETQGRKKAGGSLPGPRLLGGVSVIALGVVLAVTRAGYVYPSGSSFTEIVRDHVSDNDLSGVRDGDRICVRRDPWNMLWAAKFHPPKRYTVKEARSVEDCEGYRPIE